MAFVAKPKHTIQFSFRDNDGAQSTCEVYLPGATTPAAAITFATALQPIVSALSDATLVGMNVIFGYHEDAIGVIAPSDVENKGLFLFNAGNGVAASVTVPSILESVLLGNNKDIDQANAAVSDFLDAMTLGLGGTQPCNNSGSDLVGTKDAYKQNRRSHKSNGNRG